MKIVLTLVCHNRPDYLRQVLASIQANAYHGTSLIVVRDNATDEVRSVIDEIDWIQKRVFDMSLGINYANRHAYRLACIEDADYVVAIEDDTILAPDCLQLVHRFAEQGGAVLNCFSKSRDMERPNDVRFAIRFCPWVWAFKAKFFWDFLQGRWMRDSRGWDWSMSTTFQEFGIYAMEPVLSRSGNVGRLNGIHYTTEQFDGDFAGLVMSDGKNVDYRITG